MELYLAPTTPECVDAYRAIADAYLAKPYHERDAGLDAPAAVNVEGGPENAKRVDLGTRAAVWDPERKMFRAFWLIPRSSISKSPLRMANSVGLIDAGYRGPLMAAVDFKQAHTIHVGDRYFQIVAADLLPWSAIHVVDEIPGGPTMRGEGGFGSTGIRATPDHVPATQGIAEGAEPNVSYFG
jgi:dUTP pyrophosphatase